MADNNWQKVREIFDSVRRCQPEERQNYLIKACHGDQTLLVEVESLMSALDSAESFMETPAVAKVAGVISAETKKLETGKCFGHYEIIKQIGVGGMGEVYLAKDKKLDRKVAIKILNEQFSQDESSLNRFIQEAKAASALNHPNILTIYEFGESEDAHFIVSEFIKGHTLREMLIKKLSPIVEVLDIAIQTAKAFSVAHEAHLIHRDIKPENIMIRPDGYVKILDFGLAKLIGQNNRSILGLEDVTAKQNQTAKGVILGTVNYMSPEQAKGEKVDERTDIFSFGVVIYEMLTGRTPFAGNSVSETFANLLNAEPQPLAHFASEIPAELQRIVAKMLRKDKNARYHTMKGLLADLKDLNENLTLEAKLERSTSPEGHHANAILRATTGDANNSTTETQNSYLQAIKQHRLFLVGLIALLIGSIGVGYYFYTAKNTAVGGKKSIAILPLNPINSANRDEIYEVGIADSLINRIGSMKGFVVRPLSATRKYADIEQDAITAGKEQQVDYVLASNYQLVGGKIRITAQLLNVATGQIEETYKSSEKDASDVFAMQDAIAGEVENILLVRFATTSSSPIAKRGTTNKEAYRLFLQARYLVDKRNLGEVQKAIEILEQVVKMDANYAQAWAIKSYAHNTITIRGRNVNAHEEYQKSIEAINQALALDANLPDAQSALCEVKISYEFDFAGAERACRRALELDPHSSLAHQIYSRFLMSRGRFDEAIVESQTGAELDPAALFKQLYPAIAFYYARRYTESILQSKRFDEMSPNSTSNYLWLIGALEMQKNYAEAFEYLMKLQTLQKTDEQTIKVFKTAYQKSGWQGVLREQAKRFDEGNQPYFFGACLNAQIGDEDEAFEYLEKSYQQREWALAYLQVEPRLDPLRDDPRFDELVRRVGLK